MYKSGGNKSRPLLHILTLTASLTSQLPCHRVNRCKVLICRDQRKKVLIPLPEMWQEHAGPRSVFRR